MTARTKAQIASGLYTSDILLGDIADSLDWFLDDSWISVSPGSDQNDYNPTGLALARGLRVTATGANFSITGLAGGADGRVVTFHALRGNTKTVTLPDESSSSTSTNRFHSKSGSDVVLSAGDSATFRYSSASQRWELIGRGQAATSGGGDMLGANNLSDVASAATSRTNLGLGTAATHDSGDFDAAGAAAAVSAVLTGSSILWNGPVTPSGYLDEDGSAVSRATYAALFAALTISQSGTRTSGSAVITGLSDTSNMKAGMPVCGTGISGSTTILSVDSSTQVTLTNPATSSGTSTVVVAPWGVGDGSTTFNVPDSRDRVPQGASATDRLGKTGGNVSPSITDGGHTHGVGSYQTGAPVGTNVATAPAVGYRDPGSKAITGTSASATTGISIADARTPWAAKRFIIKT